jgi:hypothetical protein
LRAKVSLGTNRIQLGLFGMRKRTCGPCLAAMHRMQLVLFGMQNRTSDPYSAAIDGILIPSKEGHRCAIPASSLGSRVWCRRVWE